MAKARKLTRRQDQFAKAMVAVHGNQTRAAVAAGYAVPSARISGSKNMTKANVVSAVERYQARAAARTELTAEQVIGDIQEIAAMAIDAGNHQAALKGQELLGRSLGVFIDRSERLSISVDASAAHLAALVAAARKRDPRLKGNTLTIDADDTE